MLSIILPTLNEEESIADTIRSVLHSVKKLPCEIIVVDDNSNDKTAQIVKNIAGTEPSVRLIQRIGSRGLASAVIEGFLSAKGDVLIVMDADGQHDPSIVPKLFSAIKQGSNVAVASRYVDQGGTSNWSKSRLAVSRLATSLSALVSGRKTTDPMSGYFAIDSNFFDEIHQNLNPRGFKILLDILIHAPKDISIADIPYEFSVRTKGKSKMSIIVMLQFIEQLYEARFGNKIPLSFIKYCLVGFVGVFINIGSYVVLSVILREGNTVSFGGFSLALIVAIEISIVFNFFLNNIWTFRHSVLRGSALLSGFIKYNLTCIAGAVVNFSIASYLFTNGTGELISVSAGAVCSVLWNYTLSKMYTWHE